MLEVIDRQPDVASDGPPLLFVHGAWHGAWYWSEHFLDFFADKGYRSLALSLRGHANSPTPERMQFCSIADYLGEVESVAATLPAPPVLIGHSMGGFIVQKYLESHRVPAAVLLAPVPSAGIGRFLLRRMRRHPWRTAASLGIGRSLSGMAGTPELARESFYSERTPDADVRRYAALLGEEYVGKWTFDMLMLNLPKPQLITAPLLVLGAEHDGCFTQREVRATAAAYGTEAEIFPGMGHNMMLEPGWQAVAERIHSWLSAETR